MTFGVDTMLISRNIKKLELLVNDGGNMLMDENIGGRGGMYRHAKCKKRGITPVAGLAATTTPLQFQS